VVQSVELLLEPEAERGVRRAWRDLLEAGLPSQARHAALSNRPHVTLVAVPNLTGAAEDDVTPAVAGRLPVDGTWGDVALFGRGPWVLVRLLEPGDGMRALQAAVADACDVPGDSLSAPERWTAHVTLARRVSQPDVPRAVHLVRERLGREAPVGSPVVASAVRRWDGSRKVEWVVARAGGGGQP
jgi:2'-5' RNA ligase